MNAHLILLHIPKTAGTSINDIVTDWVGPDCAARHVELLSADERNALGNLRYISGHIFYDDIQRLPYVGRYKIAVSLREPHARLASTLQMLDRYNQPENKAQFAALPEVAQRVASRLSEVGFDDPVALARFFDNLDPWGYAALDNCQTRFLACDLFSSSRSPFAEAELAADAFNEAIGKLETCDFIVLTEDMMASVARLADEFAKTAPAKVLHSNRADSDEWAEGARSIRRIRRYGKRCLRWSSRIFASTNTPSNGSRRIGRTNNLNRDRRKRSYAPGAPVRTLSRSDK